uniref:Uncharacterized protein n=1 Tax=Rhizophora mucronata TaxID=61149 RepID=A0A2P2R3E6_RHIMU
MGVEFMEGPTKRGKSLAICAPLGHAGTFLVVKWPKLMAATMWRVRC